MRVHVKRRDRPEPGSISAALDSFRAEVRFYREIAPVVGVRVPVCYQAEEADEGTVLVLEDLSGWRPGADPPAAARMLAEMHRQWAGAAHVRWLWLRPVGAAAALVEQLYAQFWPELARQAPADPRLLPRPLTRRDARHRCTLDQPLATARLGRSCRGGRAPAKSLALPHISLVRRCAGGVRLSVGAGKPVVTVLVRRARLGSRSPTPDPCMGSSSYRASGLTLVRGPSPVGLARRAGSAGRRGAVR